MSDSQPNLVLIDGSGFIFRAFHALPMLTRADGTPVNAVLGFTNMLAQLLKDHTGTHIAVIFDAGRYTFRNRLYEAYKAHRPPAPEELIPQFALVREATEAFGVPADPEVLVAVERRRDRLPRGGLGEIGRASCRERV